MYIYIHIHIYFFTENSEFPEFVVIEDKVWSQDQCVRQIQEQPDYKQRVVGVYSDVPSDILNPVVVVLRGQPEGQTVLSGQEHMYSPNGVSTAIVLEKAVA